jgi:hypothetical protein
MPTRPINRFLVKLASSLDTNKLFSGFVLTGGLPAVLQCGDYRNVQNLALVCKSRTRWERAEMDCRTVSFNDIFPEWSSKQNQKITFTRTDASFSLSFQIPFAHHRLRLEVHHCENPSAFQPGSIRVGKDLTLSCLDPKTLAVFLAYRTGVSKPRFTMRNASPMDFFSVIRRWRLKLPPLMQLLGDAYGLASAASFLRVMLNTETIPRFWKEYGELHDADPAIMSQMPLWYRHAIQDMAPGIRTEWLYESADFSSEVNYLQSRIKNSDLQILAEVLVRAGINRIPPHPDNRRRFFIDLAVREAESNDATFIPPPPAPSPDPKTRMKDLSARIWTLSQEDAQTAKNRTVSLK